ncbi:MAG TPA: glycosyltransferase family 39 protein [Candidatus Acidoferrales bacterium]|nr:glycosyltransferase family 39 protein [Candidatus Acidoferrales bacterium]
MSDVVELRRPVAAVRWRGLSLSLCLSLAFAAATLGLHLATAGHYGYQRDELYFLACARHLAWGYVDQPPVIVLAARLTTMLLGTSLFALRLLPALAAAATVILTGRLAARLGGGLTAQGFAMLAVFFAPFYLAVGDWLTMNAFEPLFWLLTAYLVIEVLDEPQPWQWGALGATVALGVLTKYTVGFFALSLFVALLATPQRRILRSRGFWLAIALTLLLCAPNLWWQQSHGWPQIELLRGAVVSKDPHLSIIDFFLSQILMVHPLTFPLWVAGLVFFFRSAGGRYRLFTLSYLLLFCVYVTLHAKVYYLAPIYAILFAGGAVCLQDASNVRPMMRRAYAVSLVLVGLLILPQVVPLLPIPAFLAYQRVIDLRTVKEENHAPGRVPQQWADMLGWDGLVARIAADYAALPPAQRARAAIWTQNYGEAGAVDLLGRAYNLPFAISGHNNYYLWGTQGYDGSVVLAIGLPPALERAEFRRIRHLGVFTDPLLMPYQNNVAIDLCTQPIEPLARFWPRAKSYW